MSRWARSLALILALSPSLVFARASATRVTVVKAKSPYRQGTPASRWNPPPPRAAIAPHLGRVEAALRAASAAREVAAARQREIVALARARACKVFDRNASGTPDGGEPMVEGWRFHLSDARDFTRVRSTGWDGCVSFTGLRPGRYALSELAPPFWDEPASEALSIDVQDPRLGGAPSSPALFTGGCVHYARLGGSEYWRGRDGLRLLDDRDRRYLNSLDPFRSPSTAFAAGDEPFDGRFSDGVTRVRGAFTGSGAWGPGSWEAEVALFLGDRKVSADPRGRLAQEILVLALNARHFLERAQIVYLDDLPVFVDDLLFEAILAWHGGSPGWNHDMTALLVAVNGTNGLPYVPRDHCQVAYVPF